ncbi:hypothetical protein [Amycolatopsis cihanbeyliensis]|uniref:Uncharacterized protein n=1 Tax=Amycolatopsis cihanbeyliensis TaxID=1128664 RepID=A0A542CUF8_AMYCI|nr:hypothetical protein [Amycolatopsis cihanbeyliensis]TQI94462.1 hypothetical protein FB471_6627 [Amycolatopsis cihanbeyliensis]
MNTSHQPRDRFEDRLLVSLKQVVAERAAEVPEAAGAAPARRGPRVAIASGVAACGAAGAVVLPLALGGGSAAFAVEKEQDGTVRVEINDLRDAEELEAELGEHGINAVIDYLPEGKMCRQPRFPDTGPDMGGATALRVEGNSAVFTLRPADFRGDRALVLSTAGNRDVTGIQLATATVPVPPCEPVDRDEVLPPAPAGEGGVSHGGDVSSDSERRLGSGTG